MSKINETSRNILSYFAIKDEQLGYFSIPFCCGSDREACAIVRNSVDTSSALSKHRDCFSLYKVGIFNDTMGYFENGFNPIKICRIEDLLIGVDIDE